MPRAKPEEVEEEDEWRPTPPFAQLVDSGGTLYALSKDGAVFRLVEDDGASGDYWDAVDMVQPVEADEDE